LVVAVEGILTIPFEAEMVNVPLYGRVTPAVPRAVKLSTSGDVVAVDVKTCDPAEIVYVNAAPPVLDGAVQAIVTLGVEAP
jgi:hypothetical protein